MRWKRWGPYLSERQWGTVREDYSPDGNAWDYFPHDHARSRAYRWGEDGLAGISDEQQRLCLALALWNGRDPILKERLFGLTNGEGNHGEDVKELYYYLDATPTHSLPEDALQVSAGARSPTPGWSRRTAGAARSEPEFELLDTGVFDDDRYFDVFVEYAKAGARRHPDAGHRAQPRARGGGAFTCCRSSGSATPGRWSASTRRSRRCGRRRTAPSRSSIRRAVRRLPTCYVDGAPELLFIENETNARAAVRRRRRVAATSRTRSTST